MLKKTKLQITGFFLSLLCMVTGLHAQTIVTKGKVTDESGKPIAGASVTVKGTSKGSPTDEDGNFTIAVSPNSTLTITAVNYTAQTVKVMDNTPLLVKMIAADKSLGEVVVVGYGTQRKRDVTGAVVSVNEKTLREVPAANLQQILQGRAAGLEIQKVGTKPGAGAVIRIRGERTISGSNDPLLILDGIPYEGGSLNDINPDEILSVDILKDASATAIYGSRGSNGVILVTTKKGRSGETRVAYNGYHGVATVARKYAVFNNEEYIAMRDLSTFTSGYTYDGPKTNNTDWQDVMYENGYTTNHNINVSGGANGSTFSLGGGYYKEKTVLPGQDFSRFSLRGTIDTKIGKRLKIGLNTMNSLTFTNGSQFVNPMWGILAASPLFTPDTSGITVLSPYGNADDKSVNYSPVFLKQNNNNWVDMVRRVRTFNTLYGEYQIVTGLKYRLNVGLSYALQENDQFQSSDAKLHPSYFRPGKGNTASVNNYDNNGYTIENIVTYDKEIKKHKFTLTGLYSVQENFSHNTYVKKDSIDEDFIQFYNLGQSNPSNTSKPTLAGAESSWGLISYMARVNYSYDNRYLLTLTGRIDGSSRLAKGNNYHEYPAISAGWIISNEKFMQDIRLVNMLKLRAGLGQTSNQSISPYASLGNVSSSEYLYSGVTSIIRYNFGSTVVTGYNVLALPNENLDWEYTKTLNLGLDFSILKNRISGSLEYYKTNTNKILYGIVLPPTSGITGNYTTNLGEMSNKGFEFTLSTINIKNEKGFSWATDLNFFFNRNKLLKLSNGFSKNIASQLFIGEPLSALYDYKKLGIWQKEEAQQAAIYGARPGDIKVQDLNNDGIIDANNDRTIIGSGQADWQGGMTNRFTYKGFDFSFVLYARMGGTLVSQVYQPFAAYMNTLNGIRNNIKVNYWTPNNPSNDFPSPANMTTSVTSRTVTTLGYYDASFVKMRSINLGYTFSNSTLTKLHAQNMRIYATVQNPFVLYSPYMRMGGVDPEATGTGNQGISDPGNLSSRALTIGLTTPPTRSFNIGVNVTF